MRVKLLAGVAAGLASILAVGAVPAAAQVPPTAFVDRGFDDTTGRGINPSVSFFFPFEIGSVATAPPVLDLDLAWSPLLRGDLSTATVVANGRPLTSIRLVAEGAAGTPLRVEVPTELVTGEGLFVEVRFHLRTIDDACEDPANAALWATVRGTSTIELETETGGRDLRDVVDHLLVDGDDGDVRLVVDAGAEPAVLAAAGTTAAQLGRWMGEAGRDAVLEIAEEPGDGPAVVVGTSRSSEQGTLALSQSGPAVLEVTGSTPEAVQRAADALADEATAAAIEGEAVDLGDVGAAGRPLGSAPWRGSAASFAQLGVDERDVVGTGTQSVELRMVRPPGWTIGRGARLELDVDATPGLKRTSSIQVSVNDADLGTRRVRAGVQTLTFDVPDGLLDRRLDGTVVRTLDVRITTNLDATQERCSPTDPGAVRATILPTSAWFLPHDVTDERDLGRFPHGLTEAGGDRTVVVLPEDPDETELAAGLQLCAAIGRWAEPGSPAPLLVTADAMPDGRGTYDVVLLGDAAGDAELGDSAVTVEDDEVVARLGLVDSPWSGDRTALVVEGDADALLVAARGLASREVVTSLRGSEVVIAGAAPQSLLAADDVDAPRALAPVLEDDGLDSRVVVSVIVLVLFLLVLVVFAWTRWVRPLRR